ncbi:hypothetical protein V8E51_003528 [Hyaloscypha variabilis]
MYCALTLMIGTEAKSRRDPPYSANIISWQKVRLTCVLILYLLHRIFANHGNAER